MNYTGINYKDYTIKFEGLPDNRKRELFYKSRAVKGTTFRAGDLMLEQLAATYYSGYGYKIAIGEDDVITVTYYPGVFFFNTTNRTPNDRNVLREFPLEVSYRDFGGRNNIFSKGDYTKISSTEAPIVKIVFTDIEEFDNVKADVGNFDASQGEWTSTTGVQSVQFTGGDGYSTGIWVYLRLPGCEHDIVEDVCFKCRHGFFAYTASSEVIPHTPEALLDQDGNVLSIVKHEFEDGKGLIEFSAPLVTIGADAFAGCTALTGNLTISRNIKRICNGAFSGCSGLSDVVFSTIPQVESTAFDGVTADIRLILDDQSYVCTTDNAHFPDVASAAYTCQMVNQWGTVVMPFDIAASTEDYEVYELSQLRDDELILAKMDGIVEAGTPAIFRMNESTFSQGKYTLALEAAGRSVCATGNLAGQTVDGLTLKGAYRTIDISSEEGFIISKNKFWNYYCPLKLFEQKIRKG